MDNQQAIEIMLGGLYSGEGHFSLWKEARANGRWELRSEIGFSNSDPILIWYVIRIMDERGIRNFIRENSNGCFQVIVRRLDDMLKLLDLVEMNLLGRKVAEAALLRRFIVNRLKYQTGGNAARKCNESDFAIIAERELFRESSETKRLAEASEIRGLERYSPPRRESVLSDSVSQSRTLNQICHLWL